jgi:nucleotide-binding universal stress UspA family protein
MTEFKKILFPSDFTEASEKVLPYARITAEKFGAKLYIVHAVDDLEGWGGVYVPYSHRQDIVNQAMEQAAKVLDDFGKEALSGYANIEKRLLSGDPAAQIQKIIQDEGIDLVVMGTHGRGGLEHFIFGSVAEKVLKQSPVPVMIMNPGRVG